MKVVAMGCIAFSAIMTIIVLSMWLGPDRAQRRVEYWIQRGLEWASGEGRHRKAADGVRERD